MKLRLATIFILSFILLAPLAASATQCCWSAGQVVSGYGGAGLTPDSCVLKTAACSDGKTEVDCETKDRCKDLMPICCIYRYTDPSKKNYCYEDVQSFDCASGTRPNNTTYDVKYSRCADLADCVGASGNVDGPNTHKNETASPTSKAEYPIIVPKIPLNIPTVSLQDFTNVVQKDGFIYIPFISVFLIGAYKLGVGIAAILAVIMIMAGGFIWIAAAGDTGRIGQAKTMISGAVVGLVLTVGSYVALQTVNPNLVNFTALKIPVVGTQMIDVINDYDPETDTVSSGGDITTGANTSDPSQYDAIFEKYAPCAGVTPEVLKAIAQAESGLNATKVNKSGYTGLFQTKEANCPAVVMNYCKDLTNPDNNTAAGAAMIKSSVNTIKSRCPTASAHDQMIMIYVGHNMGGGMLKYVTQNGCNTAAMRKSTIDYYVNNPGTARKYALKYQPGCLNGRTDDTAMAECTGGPKYDYAVKIANKATGISQVISNAEGTCPY